MSLLQSSWQLSSPEKPRPHVLLYRDHMLLMQIQRLSDAVWYRRQVHSYDLIIAAPFACTAVPCCKPICKPICLSGCLHCERRRTAPAGCSRHVSMRVMPRYVPGFQRTQLPNGAHLLRRKPLTRPQRKDAETLLKQHLVLLRPPCLVQAPNLRLVQVPLSHPNPSQQRPCPGQTSA